MNRKNKKYTTFFIVCSLLLIGVVYAILQANLQINGIAKIKSNSWDVHFDNIVVNENSVAIGTGDTQATIDPENNCKVDFEVTLSLPGDFYEFTVDVVNAGTIDGMIGEFKKTLVVNNEVVSEIPDYLEYVITYVDGLEILENHALNAGEIETYKVRLEFKTDIEELPSATTITASLEPQYIQADSSVVVVNHPFNLYNVFEKEARRGTGLVSEYTGSHKDSFTQTGTEKIYYWTASSNDNANTILDKWNVIFGGFCWQMIRTTDTGGVKLIYNGEVVNNQCLSTRGDHIGYDSYAIQDNESVSNWWYGTGYTYSTWTNKFKINGTTEQANWSEYSGTGLVGKYTCLSTEINGNCSTLYYVVSYDTSKIYFIQIKTGSHYSQIGTIQFNNNDSAYSMASAGYMYNLDTMISYKANSTATSGSLFGTGVTYSNGTYTLTSTSTTYDDTHHYTCNNTTGSCSNVRYYYYNNFYTELSDGRNIEEAIEDMLSSDDVNQTNSIIKTAVDAWYKNNMILYTSKLEDTIFCNDRSLLNYSSSGWNPNGGPKKSYLQFKSNDENNDLSCTNTMDQFSMNNSKAQLTYPVGLLTPSEAYLLNNNILRGVGESYWLSSSSKVSTYGVVGIQVYGEGNFGTGNYVSYSSGARPVISIKPSIMVTGGDGSKTTPYVVE